jgi:hypoxanthine phosphoribosyltransferase
MALDVLLSAEAIRTRVAELAREIEALVGDETVVLVCVLKGAVHFLSDLSRELHCASEIDFMQTSSYGSGKSSSGVVQILKDLDINIEGRDVIIVEDIVDTGVTLSYLADMLTTRRPKSLKIVTFLSKPEARKVKIAVDLIGFEIPNEFVVGYGLDLAEKYRNLPFVSILRQD